MWERGDVWHDLMTPLGLEFRVISLGRSGRGFGGLEPDWVYICFFFAVGSRISSCWIMKVGRCVTTTMHRVGVRWCFFFSRFVGVGILYSELGTIMNDALPLKQLTETIHATR